MRDIRLATRGSRLALAQAEAVSEALKKAGVRSEIVTVSTKGDKNKVSPLVRIGGNGLFVREIEKALIAGDADIAIHCGKDLPFEIDERLMIAGTPKAADYRDCLVSVSGKKPEEKSVIGTGSPRRIAEYSSLHNDAKFKDIRGNITTRIEKLNTADYDAVILAKAGLDRIGFDKEGFEIRTFEANEMIPAACQGILALECRRDDKEAQEIIEKINDTETFKRFKVERYLFCSMRADCTSAVGVYAEIDGEELNLIAMHEGKRAEASGALLDYKEMCEDIICQIK